MTNPDPTTDAAAPPRYIVGIDLGTTNCAVAFVDTAAGEAGAAGTRVRTWTIPQLVAAGTVEGRENLPSFLYCPAEGEFPPHALAPPWGDPAAVGTGAKGAVPEWAVGTFARDHGAKVPGRQVSSSKSWLCHPGVDRTAPLLPWHAAEGVERLSPVEASAALLAHLRAAWDHAHPHAPLAEQDVVLTLPASFDEVARELTVKAARTAGLPRVVLIEEPQAAFYAWLARHPDNWQEQVAPNTNVLVCDIGGGTSDFALIRVKPPASPSPLGGATDGKVEFHRVAVGEHLILGGDNLDLALAHHLEDRLKKDGTELAPKQWDVLVRQSRRAKETLLGEDAPASVTVTLPGAGRALVAGGLSVSADGDAARAALLEGFLPTVPVTAVPDRKDAGFREVGLPYAADAGITRHLARFLSTHGAVAGAGEGEPARPDAVLFNGGFFASPVLRDRLLGALSDWFPTGDRPVVLANDRLDLAVSRGAAYFGLVRRGLGVRVEAGLARTYYLGAEDGEHGEPRAVCVVPAGTRPGETVRLPDTPVRVRVGRPVELPVFSSGVRLTDPAGSVHAVDETQFASLPLIRTVLKAKGKEGDELPALLEAGLSEIGTLDLAVRERREDGTSGNRWRLSFDVRSTTRTDLSAHAGAGEAAGVADDETLAALEAVLDDAFGSADGSMKPSLKPRDVNDALAEAAGSPRSDWPPTLLRSLWEGLMDRESGRRESSAREARWLNLLGYALRPGYGVALDDWRVAETWRRLHGRLAHADPAVVSQSHVLWRRIGGGLEAGQQRALASPLMGAVKSGGKKGPAADPELLRLLASLERLPTGERETLGRAFVKLAAKEENAGRRETLWWAVGRTGARVPLYGPANSVVPARVAADWADSLIGQFESLPDADDNRPPLWPVVQLARKTGDRYLDFAREPQLRVMQWLAEEDAPSHWVALVRDGGRLDHEEEGLAFGESLPAGLRLG
ncbi:hsp70 family protein [Alienimonas californiensis]|uniref:Chaperone protein HscA n=1 Tax=Alienimonas californiensis TaxID=2527989 RepID=A0A517PC02_9PLAN|nr:hsp70 family protein [Alienimonas californiensis]QDT16915.1 Chaperone protein HscA [Alienimonas californiensis]